MGLEFYLQLSKVGEPMKKLTSTLSLLSLVFLLSGCPGSQFQDVSGDSSLGSQGSPIDPKPIPLPTYDWSVGNWSACSAKACGTNGTQTRSVVCKRSDGVSVSDVFCSTTKPATSKPCSAPDCPPSTTTTMPAPTTTVPRPTTTTMRPTTTTTTMPPPTTTLPSSSDTVNVMDKGAKADGVTNDLKAFQAAVAAVPKNGTVWVPAGKYLLDVSKKNNIAMKSNMTFKMDPNAILMVKPNALTHYYVINTLKASNLEIYGGQLVGDRNQHQGTTGEWGFGIRISGGQHIKIHDMKISDMWGDGICTGEYPDDVVIQRILATNNRRQGLSITTGTNFQVLDSEFSFTKGTPPEYGIDIEPDNPDKGNYARNILIQGNYFHDNKAGGVQPYKNSQNVTIKNNRFSTGAEGIYIVNSIGGLISENTFDHVKYEAVHLSGADSYEISDNVFRKTNMTGNLISITGLTGKATSYIIKSSATNLEVGTNHYGN
jgi:parallel beta-helix repeat protein